MTLAQLQGMARFIQMHEAAASIALTHPRKCECVHCRAANGDREAQAQIMDELVDA